MGIGELHSHHLPVALALVEVPIENDVLLLPARRPVPSADSGPRRMQIGDDETPAAPQYSEHFPVVGIEVRQVALVEK